MRRKAYCVLATQSAQGIDARVLQPYSSDDELEVWFGTSRQSRKVAQLRENPAATVVFQNDSKGACVTLLGTMSVIESLPERIAHFRPTWWAFFPEGPGGSDFVVLRFIAHRAHVWDAARHIIPPPFGTAAATLVRRDGHWSAP